MIANYHTHTYRCNHASGVDEEYVRCAVEAGLPILGFSDHSPYIFPGTHYSGFRMRPHLLQDYCESILKLRDAYADRVQVLLGLEVEYYPALFSDLLAFLKDYPVQYKILGQHFIGNEIGCPYSGAPTEDAAVLTQYCDQSMEAMQTGEFLYMAHPDLLKFTGDDKTYRREMRRLCREAAAMNFPLEINFLGMRDGRSYPDWRFWELAAEEGCTVVFGSDAHSPEMVTDPASEKTAREVVQRLGLKLVEQLTV